MFRGRRYAPALVLAIVVMAAYLASAGENPSANISPALEFRLTASPGEAVRAWVFFTDKGDNPQALLAEAEAALVPKARARRARSRPGRLVEMHDVPVRGDYVAAVSSAGARVRHTSRWFNAVSVVADRATIERVAGLRFVARVDLVRSYGAPLPETTPLVRGAGRDEHRLDRSPASFDYGPSFTQNQQIAVVDMHDIGFDGTGVTIAVLDAGFNNLEHVSLQHLDIQDTWDFVNGDSNVDDEIGQMGTGNHGTLVLSALAGFKSGALIGPAFNATYLLYKTENTDWERHIEEDDWVAGAERADSVGAEIITTSLGYRYGFTHGETDYTSADMDGNTAISTIGADIAAANGILIFASVGNNYAPAPGENTIIAPSDGDSVIAVGAVDAAGVRAGFSSVGPAADGRIKPDVMAMGQGTVCASPYDPIGYSTASGTSLSCPMAAGAAALVLQSNPTLSNMEIRDRLRENANNASSPDSLYGWGIIDAFLAAFPASTSSAPNPRADVVRLYPAVPNPFNPSTVVSYEIPEPGRVRLTVHDLRGSLVSVLVDGERPPGRREVPWDGTDLSGRPVVSGVYFFRLQAPGGSATGRAVLLK